MAAEELNGNGRITVTMRPAMLYTLLAVLLGSSGGIGISYLRGPEDSDHAAIVELQRKYSKLGGTDDPMNARVAALERQSREIYQTLTEIKADLRVIRYRLQAREEPRPKPNALQSAGGRDASSIATLD